MGELITSGNFGRVMTAVLRDDQYFPTQGQYRSTWRSEVSSAGGGTLMEHSIHDIDLLLRLLGEPSEVATRTASFFGHPGIEDLATVMLTFDSGSSASLISIWHQVLSRPSTRRLEVFCEEAVLSTDDDYTGPLHLEQAGGAQSRPLWCWVLPAP